VKTVLLKKLDIEPSESQYRLHPLPPLAVTKGKTTDLVKQKQARPQAVLELFFLEAILNCCAKSPPLCPTHPEFFIIIQ
jgi:hypothetical protein